MSVHSIQSWRDVPHQAHQEERNLQDRVGQEVHPPHELIIPGYGIKVDEEG